MSHKITRYESLIDAFIGFSDIDASDKVKDSLDIGFKTQGRNSC